MNDLLRAPGGEGGEVIETGYVRVIFQKGFPSEVGVNGCRVEDVLEVAAARLEEYQDGPLACKENEEALRHIRSAMVCLNERIHRRKEQGVLNTMSPHQDERTEDEEEDFSATGA
ncbi:MAG TPA: hypothetical protein VK934_03935 [Fimbriimonas sp.]|nr:hypothetical protein [Fimbriimonas sp.]